MFTGIVEEVGKLQSVVSGHTQGEITIQARKVLQGTQIGDSIAVNGVCLTVTKLHNGAFSADVMPETLRRSNLGKLRLGSPVNLERAMSAEGRFGGHIVSGHIDATGTISEMRNEGNAVWVRIKTSSAVLALVVEKGSIAIDGISLTVAKLGADNFQVSVIPHTGNETTLLSKRVGDEVNLENDIIAKYVQRLLNRGVGTIYGAATTNQSRITMEFLAENGF